MTESVLGISAVPASMTWRWRMPVGRRSRRPGASRRTISASARSTASRWSSCRAMAAATAIPPSQINYRANIDAMKRAGVTDLVSLSAVRLAAEDLRARHLRARRPVHRPHLRAREELLRHRLRRPCVDGRSRSRRLLGDARRGGSPGDRHRPASAAAPISCMEGPQFSTLAEIRSSTAAGAAT